MAPNDQVVPPDQALVADAVDTGSPVGDDPRRSATGPRAPRRFELRRVPSRVVLIVSFCVGLAALGLCVMPFRTAGPDGTSVQCGPPLYEVVVPPDPAFDVIENSVCTAPARLRLIVGGAALVGAVIISVTTQRRSRQGTLDRQAAWLAGQKRRPDRPRPSRSPVEPAGDDAPALAGPTDGESARQP